MILIPRFTFSVQSWSSQWRGSLVWLASSHLGCCNDFLNQTFLSHAHASIISAFCSNAKTFDEVTFHLQVESFISKFLDWLINAFFIWCGCPGMIIILHVDDAGTAAPNEGTFPEPCFQQHFVQMQTPGPWRKL